MLYVTVNMADSYWTRRRGIKREIDAACRELDCSYTAQNSDDCTSSPTSTDASVCLPDTNSSFEHLENDFDFDINLDDRYSSDASSDSEPVGCDGDAANVDPKLDVLLADWVLQYAIPMALLGGLLKILNFFHPNLPLDPRTLMKTPRCCAVRTMSDGGQYAHFGLQKGIINLIKSGIISDHKQTLELQFNVDGLPLFKSSSTTLWPILSSKKLPIKQTILCWMFLWWFKTI